MPELSDGCYPSQERHFSYIFMRTHRAFQRLYIFEGENMSTLKNTFFIPPPDTPTQAGPENIFYDFNDGARVLLPEGKWHVRLLDADRDIKTLTGNLNVPGG